MSYRGDGPWDGGPPGAEADYATQRAPSHPSPSARTLPATDPWTGVSYSQYASGSGYEYQTYSTNYTGYSYDSSYYQNLDSFYGKYPDSRQGYSEHQPHNSNYYRSTRPQSRSPVHHNHCYEREHKPYRGYLKKDSYDDKERDYMNSKRRHNSYGSRDKRSRSLSNRESRSKKYSSSDRSSSRSSSHSRRSRKIKYKRRSVSSDSSGSKSDCHRRVRDITRTPPMKSKCSLRRSKSYSGGSRSHSGESSRGRKSSISPRMSQEKERLKMKHKEVKSHSSKNKTISSKDKISGIKIKKESTSSRKGKSSVTPPKTYRKSDRDLLTPPRGYKTKDSGTPPRHHKGKESSVTPPKSYMKGHSRSSSRGSRHSRSLTPKSRSRRSITSGSITPPGRSRSRSHSRKMRNPKRRSRSNRSSSRSRSDSRPTHSVSRSRSRSASKSRRKRRSEERSNSPKSRSHSRQRDSRSRSQSGERTSEDERRGQFTVADRKRYWKLHNSKHDDRSKENTKSPPKETKPPPGAIEPAAVDDIEYGDPPEVEGPNFAELPILSDQAYLEQASTSKGKAVPISIKNDGSFLEMFKKMQEVTKKETEVVQSKPVIKKPALPFIGKRRGGRVLKTGLVKKPKAIDEQPADSTPKDAWSLYMQEVKKYRETSCEEERKTRPLVK